LLNKMAHDGWVTYTQEQEGNRPPRRVFAITPAGEAAFQQLLRESLAKSQPMVYAGNIGLLFLDAIPPEEALRLLEKRRASVEGVLQEADTHEVFEEASSLLLLHQERHLTTELDWLDEVIARIDQSDDDGELTGGFLA
jgi:DNA-binding PadR family transcriptional regulator